MLKHPYRPFVRLFLLLSAAVVIWGCSEQPTSAETESAAAVQDTAAEADTNAAPVQENQVDGFTDIVLGDPDAPITVIEYASMTCGHCADFHRDVYPDFKKNFVDTGRARYIMRHFVLNGPDLAASMIARCVDSSRYHAFLNLFLGRQATWMAPWHNVTPGDDKSLADLAEEAEMDAFLRPVGIGTEKMRACLDNGKLRDDLIKQRAVGQQEFDIRATPTLIINGQKYDGAHEYAAFARALERAE